MTSKLKWAALGALAFVAGCAGLAEKREREARAAYPPIGQLLDVGGTQVHAWTQGTGPDLILIHGASGNLRDFTFDLAGRLSERYRVIAFDRPGMGYTDRLPGYGGYGSTKGEPPLEQAALLQAAAAQLGAWRPIVLGHSFGGAIALAWGLSAPEETGALVLLGGVALPWPGDLGTFYDLTGTALGGATAVPLIAALAPQSRIDKSIASIFTPQTPPPGYADYVGASLTLLREALRANGQQVLGLRPHIVEMSERYAAELTMPIEIVHGAEDTTVPLSIHSEPFAALVSTAHLTVLEGIGHMPHHADPAATIAAIDRAAARARLRP